MKTFKKIALILLVVVVGIQFIRLEKNRSNEPLDTVMIQETNPSKATLEVMRKACYDCHSNNTKYPWYSEIAPISFVISHHVNEGKKHFNVSSWDTYSSKKKAHKLEELIEEVQEGEMPLSSYTLIHKEAVLTSAEKQVIVDWAKASKALYESQK